MKLLHDMLKDDYRFLAINVPHFVRNNNFLKFISTYVAVENGHHISIEFLLCYLSPISSVTKAGKFAEMNKLKHENEKLREMAK